MDPKLKLQLIHKAQAELVNNPQDFMHEITHHYRVVLLMQELVRAEKLQEQVDLDLLEVICWWHDVKVQDVAYPDDKRVVQITAGYLSAMFPNDLRTKAHDSIINHEFGSTPNFIEGKILQDADKLEILSEPRVDLTVDNIKAGKADKTEMLELLESIRSDTLPIMLERYHFEYSRNYHRNKIDTFLEYLEQAEQIIRNL